MARPALKVTHQPIDTTRLPDGLTEGAALLVTLGRCGALAQIGQRLHIRRQGGYSGLGIWLFLFLYFTAGLGRGLRSFWKKTLHAHHKALAAIAARRSLPSPASVSRALRRVENDLIRPIEPWLLQEVPQIDDLLRHPAVQTRDANGDFWHVVDYDPSNTVLRQRGLPHDDDLPEPGRRSEHTAAPGHTGRKRGNMVFRKNVAQHAGAGAWLHLHLSPGNGDSTEDLRRALETAGQTFKRIDHPRDRTMFRFDGEFGWLPDFTACRENNQPFIGRLNRPKLFEDPAFLARLRAATWYRVPDSLSGPRRAAADLGEWTLEPGKRTRRPDGSRYEPITLRVVASRFQPASGKAKRGRMLDGWQIELFAADLPADAWPAPEAVAAYFGRNGTQENRFAQEDRELGLDRIFSYHLPGQELACLVGLMVWNFRLVQGFLAEPPPVEPAVQRLRQAVVDERVPENWPRDPQVVAALGEVDFNEPLKKKPEWSFDAATGTLRCADGRVLEVTTVRKKESVKSHTGVIFRRPAGGCESCTVRAGCLKSSRAEAHKHAEFSIPSAVANRLRARLSQVRAQPPWLEPTPTAGRLSIADPLFLPAMARQMFAERFERGTLWVEVMRPPPTPPRPRLVAVDVADRQRRRKTWEQNLARYALPEGAEVHVEVAGTIALRQMVGGTNQQILEFSGSG